MVGNELNLDSLSKNTGKVTEFTSNEVLSEIQRQKDSKKSWVKNLAILLVTLFVFFQIGLLKNNLVSIVLLVVVIFIHELGHWIGMQMFGYRNVQMFFIPMFGAAVSGQSQNVPAYKKAIVCLLGPVPGIVLGCILLIMYVVTDNSFFFQLTFMFLLINAFNLLPFFPLDGGRFLQEVLFCRNRYFELCFRAIASLCLIGIALLLKAWILFALAILGFITLGTHFKVAGITHEIKELFIRSDSAEDMDDSPYLADRKDIFQGIVDRIHERFPSQLQLKHFAGYAKIICDQVFARPPKLGATLLLLGAYGFSFFFSLITIAGASVVSITQARNHAEGIIIKYTKSDGTEGYKEQKYILGNLTYEDEFDESTGLYHGSGKQYYQNGNISTECTWRNGKFHGEHKGYDLEGTLTKVTVFDNGSFISHKEKKGDGWADITWEDLSFVRKKYYQKHQNRRPYGPDRMQIEEQLNSSE